MSFRNGGEDVPSDMERTWQSNSVHYKTFFWFDSSIANNPLPQMNLYLVQLNLI